MGKMKIEFSVEGTILRGDFYMGARAQSAGPLPTVIMAHGFSAQRDHYLAKFAHYFAAHSLNVLVYDHRNWGESEGEVRYEIDPAVQIRDYRNAISFAESLPQVDAAKIGIWGTSYSGGHVLVVGAIDKRVKAVVSQVPFVDGYENFRRRTHPEAVSAVEKKFVQELKNRGQGLKPEIFPVVSSDPKKKAVIPGIRAYDFFTSVANYPNQVTLHSLEMARDYVPMNFISRLSPTPLLMLASLHDSITPTDLQLKAYQMAMEPKKLVTLKGDHFSAYLEEFETAAGEACRFFREYL